MTDRDRHEPLPPDAHGTPATPPTPPPPAPPADPTAGSGPHAAGQPSPPPPPPSSTYWQPQPPIDWSAGAAATPPAGPEGPYRPSAAPEAADRTAHTGPVPTTEVRRSGGAKWGVALVVVALAIGVTAAGIFLLTGSTTPSILVGYAPANSVVYGEVRLDLPGDQRAKLADFLAHFPGFDDRSTLETKIIQTLDLRLDEATGGEIDYSTDIQPWFGGQVGFSLNEPPDPLDQSSARGAVYLSVTDGVRALDWVEDLGEGAFESTTYGGTEMLIEDQDEFEIGLAVADERVMVVGDRRSVEQAIDSRGESGLANDPDFAAALAAAPSTSVGFMFMDNRAFPPDLGRDVGAADPLPCGLGGAALEELLPAWTAFGLRIESDGVRLDAIMPEIPAVQLAANETSRIAEYAPPNTILLYGAGDVGRLVTTVVDIFRDCPELADGFEDAESMLQAFGGVNGLVDWIDDASFVLAASAGGGLDGGVVITPTDAGNARERLTALYNLIVLGGPQLGIRASQEDYNGASIRTISGNLEDLSMLGGAPASGVEGQMEFAYTATDDIVIFGGNATFVKAALDAAAGDSLADSERYRSAIAKTGASNAGAAYVDVTKLRELAELNSEDLGIDLEEYRTEILPWIEPFDVIVQSTVSGNPMRANAYVIVKE